MQYIHHAKLCILSLCSTPMQDICRYNNKNTEFHISLKFQYLLLYYDEFRGNDRIRELQVVCIVLFS